MPCLLLESICMIKYCYDGSNVNIIRESVQNMVSRDGGKGKNPYQALEINIFGLLLLLFVCLFCFVFFLMEPSRELGI